MSEGGWRREDKEMRMWVEDVEEREGEVRTEGEMKESRRRRMRI